MRKSDTFSVQNEQIPKRIFCRATPIGRPSISREQE